MITKALKEVLNFSEFFNNVKVVRANDKVFKRKTNALAISASIFAFTSILSIANVLSVLPDFLVFSVIVSSLIACISLIFQLKN